MEVADAHGSFTTWGKLLSCGICWGIYKRPHTLKCGHSFCARCLRNLAMLTREQFPQAPVTRLKISCPTCRKKTLVSSLLTRRLSVNYSIQDFIDNWREQDKKFQGEYYVSVRSIGTQSNTQPSNETVQECWRDDTETDLDISIEEEGQIPCRVDVMSFPNFEDSSDESLNGRVNNINNEDLSDHSDSPSDTSSNGDLVDNFDRLVVWRMQRRPEFIGFPDVLWNWFTEIQETLLSIFECRSRSVMAMIWCGYTFSIMIIANGFFPYMILYSFLFFVILYAETSHERRNRVRFW